MFSSLARNLDLIGRMTRQQVVGRYRGSIAGLVWTFAHPLLMLGIYTIVFSVVFQVRWGAEVGDKVQFATILFAGLIVHSLFAECLMRSPSLVSGNVNYVKKVVFPLEVLPWVTVSTALFHAAMSLLVLVVFLLVSSFTLQWTLVLVPLVLLPFVLFTVGVSWFLSSLGVYVPDISQVTGLATTALLFLSPVFYPVSAIPQAWQPVLYLNPLTFIIEQVRAVVIWGNLPDWSGLAIYLGVGIASAMFGHLWFQRTRRGFADVL